MYHVKQTPEISVAPMLDWTDRHCRVFLRSFAPHVRLYTEMVTTGAIIFGDRDRYLAFSPSEHPVALQLGGSDPAHLGQCAAIGADYGYDEINLNCGCPSDRVQNGAFGACLMKDPGRVGDCVSNMINAAQDTEITVKCRIGVDECVDEEFLHAFVKSIHEAGCRKVIIHARKAWLKGLSPKENREIPPLRYDIAAGIKTAFPDMRVIVNGGIKTLAETQSHLDTFDGVMIGREAYQNPWVLTEIEQALYGHITTANRADIARAMIPYIEERRATGTPVKSITRHMLGLYQGQRGGRVWRRILSTEAHLPGTTGTIIETALAAVDQAVGPEWIAA